MEIYVLNGLSGITDIVDVFQSVIWNVQFYDKNDFQLVVPATQKNLDALQVGRYLVRDEDIDSGMFNNVMMIKNYQLDFDSENGWILTVTGRGLKSIVGQRIV